VRELDNPEVIVGHNKYDYYDTNNRQVLWMRFSKSWTQALEEDVTLGGLPLCVYN
jgi:hypothetical protein